MVVHQPTSIHASMNRWNHRTSSGATERCALPPRAGTAALVVAWTLLARPALAYASSEPTKATSRPRVDPALASVAVAIGGATVSAVGQWRSLRLQKRLEAEREYEKREEESRALQHARRKAYAEPLAMAAHDLQARLHAIAESNLLQRAFSRAQSILNDETRLWERAYAVDYTCYLLAQFLAWLEIVRQEEPQLALSGEEEKKRFRRCVDEAEYAMRKGGDSDLLWIYQGVMRAIGELMVVADEGGNGKSVPVMQEPTEGGQRRSRPLGFAAFMRRKAEDESFRRWFRRLEDDLIYIAEHDDIPKPQLHRIVKLQDAVLHLVEFLDEEVQAIPYASKVRIDLDKYAPISSQDEFNTEREPKSNGEDMEEAPPPPTEDEEDTITSMDE